MNPSDENNEYQKSINSTNKIVTSFSGKKINEFDTIIQGMSLYEEEMEFQNTEYKKISDELLKEKQRFSELFENTPIGQISINQDFTIQHTNSAFADIVGENKNNIIQKSIFNFIQPDSKELFNDYLTDIINIKAPSPIIVEINTENKAVCNYQIYSYLDESSKNTSIISSFHKVSNPPLKDDDTIGYEDWINSIFRVAPICIGVVKNRVINEINSKIGEMLGYSRNELIGQSSRILYPTQEEYDYVGEEKYRQIALYGTGTVETRWKCKSGSIINILLSSTPFDTNNLDKGIMFTALDITTRKKAELDNTKILAENHRLSKALEHSPAHIVITDYEGNVEYVNPKFTEVTGFGPNEVYGKNLRILKSGMQSQEFYENFWETIKSGKEWRGEFLNKKKNGNLYWENNSISCIKNENGEITHFVAIKEDITERKKIEKELIHAKEQAEESSRLKTAFLNNISHEVRTPMNAIVGFADLLYDNNLPKEKQGLYVDTINSSSRQLLRIIDDVLEISRLESGSIKLKLNNFSLTELFKDICVTLEKEALSYDLSLTFDYLENDPFDYINADREKIKQILTGLIINAFKFTPKGGVKTGYFFNKNKLTFYVKDTGIGIPKSEQRKVFERFYKVEQNQSYRNKGTGLGLSIAKGLVEIMGGEIWVESEPGEGTAFYFTAFWEPAIRGSQPAETTENEQSVFNIEVLVVDDELYNYTYLSELLEKRVAKIYWARNGMEAINIVENYKIDLILMDLKMPGMNGFEATKTIKEKFPHINIIAQSAYTQTEEKENALKAGCDDYITKPISKNQLLKCMQKNIKAGK
jgi:PAS domain S-box-containing protein